jgi:formate/nitrite transporter FocA (FNT family)
MLNNFFSKSLPFMGYCVKPDRLRMTMLRMRVACWVTRLNTHVISNNCAFPLQPFLPERTSMSRYMDIAYLVPVYFLPISFSPFLY